jgi:CRP-like cAMP-binding protein
MEDQDSIGDSKGSVGLVTSASSPPKPSAPKVMAFMEKGQMFGELSFLLGGQSTASVLAHETEVEVQIIEDAYLNILFVRQPALAGRFYHHLASLLANRIKESEKRALASEAEAS